jgi:hypothetical protein
MPSVCILFVHFCPHSVILTRKVYEMLKGAVPFLTSLYIGRDKAKTKNKPVLHVIRRPQGS